MREQIAMRRNLKELAVAYHEAGHAVIDRVVLPQIAVRYVTIIPNKAAGTLGHCRGRESGPGFRPDIETNPRTRNRLESLVMGILAGAIAEQKFTGKNNWAGSCSDREKALSFASHMSGGGKVLDTYVEYLWARTEELVCTPIHWECIKALAEKLVAERTVSGKAVNKLIQDVRNAFIRDQSRHGGIV